MGQPDVFEAGPSLILPPPSIRRSGNPGMLSSDNVFFSLLAQRRRRRSGRLTDFPLFVAVPFQRRTSGFAWSPVNMPNLRTVPEALFRLVGRKKYLASDHGPESRRAETINPRRRKMRSKNREVSAWLSSVGQEQRGYGSVCGERPGAGCQPRERKPVLFLEFSQASSSAGNRARGPIETGSARRPEAQNRVNLSSERFRETGFVNLGVSGLVEALNIPSRRPLKFHN